MYNESSYHNMAPTTVDSKNILQQHHLSLPYSLLNITSDKEAQCTNLGLISSNIESSTIKTFQPTNSTRHHVELHHQHTPFNQYTVQVKKDLGISAAANSLRRNHSITLYRDQVKSPLD